MAVPNWASKCAVVIPCRNEARTIHTLVTEVRRTLPRVVVIDDGCSDGTAEAATRAGAKVVRHETNRGKGDALRTGLDLALREGLEWALMMDGDGQHAPGDIPRFLQAAERSNAALIVGNRMAHPHGMPLVRRFVNRWMSNRLSRAAGRSLPDTQCGFRLIRLEAYAKLKMETSRFEVESEMLLAAAAAGLAIEFVPIEVIYRSEKSKIQPLTDTVRWFRWFRRRRRGGGGPAGVA